MRTAIQWAKMTLYITEQMACSLLIFALVTRQLYILKNTVSAQ
jgi:hypothetical protein